MRPLTKNERFLLGVLGFVIWGIVTIVGYRWISTNQAKLDQENLKLTADQADAEVSLADKSIWDDRLKWVTAHQAILEDENLAGAKLQKSLQDSAGENHLEVQTSKIESSDLTGTLPSIAVSIEVKGSMQSVILWINQFQSSKDLLSIEECDLKMDNDQKNMTCSLRLRQFFQAKS